MEPERAPTHDEIWDDSALVDSWNEALEEYKKYHSIHAKGGTVDDIEPAANTKTRPAANAKPETDEAGKPIAKDDEKEDGEVDETMSMDESDETSHPPISEAQESGDATKADGKLLTGPAPIAPSVFLGNVQDEELKKLLMSWYYAGLYEGKQQGLQQAEEARKKP